MSVKRTPENWIKPVRAMVEKMQNSPEFLRRLELEYPRAFGPERTTTMTTKITIHTSAESPLKLEAVTYNGHVWVSIHEGENIMFSLFPPPGTSYESLRVACEAFNAALASGGQQPEAPQAPSAYALGDQPATEPELVYDHKTGSFI